MTIQHSQHTYFQQRRQKNDCFSSSVHLCGYTRLYSAKRTSSFITTCSLKMHFMYPCVPSGSRMCPTHPSFVCSSTGLNHYTSHPRAAPTSTSFGSTNMWRTVAILRRTLNGVPVSTTFFSTTSSADAFVTAPRPTSASAYASVLARALTSVPLCRGLNASSGQGRKHSGA